MTLSLRQAYTFAVLTFSFSFFVGANSQEVFRKTSLDSFSSQVIEKARSILNLKEPHPQRADENLIPTGFCKTWIGTEVGENSTWEEPHCRKCHCDMELGSVCQDPVCEIAFHPYLESNCEQWSSDGCCCERSTCAHDGVHYAADEWFLLTPSDPCTLCKCDPSDGLPRCLETTCPKLECVDPTSVPRECCPLCLTGHNCRLPPLSLPENDTLADVTPLPYTSSRLVTLTFNTDLAWNCTCTNPGQNADCISFAAMDNTSTTTP